MTIINAYINGRDFIHLADELGIARQTVRDIVAVYERTGCVESCQEVVVEELKSMTR